MWIKERERLKTHNVDKMRERLKTHSVHKKRKREIKITFYTDTVE